MARPRLEPGEWGKINTGSTTATGKVRARTRYRTTSDKIILLEAVGDTEEAAIRSLHRKIRDWQPVTATTFTEAATDWLDHETRHGNLRPQSAYRYRQALTLTLAPLIGERPASRLSAPEVQRALDTIHYRKRGEYGTCITVCRGTFNYAIQQGIATQSPMSHIKRHVTKVGKPQALTVEEITQLRNNVRKWQSNPRRTQPLLDVMDLSLSTAARIGELLALKWADVDLHDRTLTLTGTQVRIHGIGTVDQPETKESIVLRTHLTDFALDTLTRRRAHHPDDVYVFPSRSGGMIDYANLDRAWRAARGPQFDWVTWHIFRKSVATLAARATDSHTAAKLLGHTTDRTTRRHYIANDVTVAPDLTHILEELGRDVELSFDD